MIKKKKLVRVVLPYLCPSLNTTSGFVGLATSHMNTEPSDDPTATWSYSKLNTARVQSQPTLNPSALLEHIEINTSYGYVYRKKMKQILQNTNVSSRIEILNPV